MSSSSTGFFSSVLCKKSIFISKLLLIALAFCLFTLPTYAQYEAGSGADGSPYLISTAEQLNEIGNHPNHWNKHFKLISNINMAKEEKGCLKFKWG